MEEDKSKNSRDSFLISFGVYGAIGFQLAFTIVAGLLGGAWIDKKMGTAPWIALVGLLIGAIGGFYNLIRIVSWKNRNKNGGFE